MVLVVLDLSGTTVKDNRDVHRVLRDSLALFNVDISIDDADDVMGIPKPLAIHALLHKRYSGERPITPMWIEEIHKKFVRDMVSFYKSDSHFGEKPGVSETFRRLKMSDVKIIIDTGFSRQITDTILERVGWLRQGLIDGSVSSDEVEFGRPYPDMIYRAMHMSGVKDLNNVTKVGDTISDLQQGLNAGCRNVVGVTSGAHGKVKLSTAYHTHLIENLSELPAIVLAPVDKIAK